MILKADHRAGPGFLTEAKGIILNHSCVRADSMEINGSEKFTFYPVMRLIIVSHHLIAAADAQKGLPILHRSLDFRSLAGVQIAKKDLLLEVLSASDEKQIIGSQILFLSDFQFVHMAVNSTPGKSPGKTADVAAVAVQI